MPVYDHDRDREEAADARATQEDPSVMYLVVRKVHGCSLEALMVAAAQATLDCAMRWSDDPRYADEFAYWGERSFRKVCLRANEKEWPRVADFDAGVGRVNGEVVVRALPPRRRSAREKLLGQLQAYNAARAELAQTPVALDGNVTAMALVVNGALDMRCGKLAAQIGHAILLGATVFSSRDPDAMRAWAEGGFACAVLRAEGEVWGALQREEACALIRDAGLTEIERGSETVLALRPAVLSQWSERVRALPRIGG